MRKKSQVLNLAVIILVFIFLSFSLYSCEEPKYSRIDKKPEKSLEPIKEFKGVILDEDLGRRLAENKDAYSEGRQESGQWMDEVNRWEQGHRILTTSLLIQSIRNQQKILSGLESQGTIRPSAEGQTPSVETLPKVYPSIPESGAKPFRPE